MILAERWQHDTDTAGEELNPVADGGLDDLLRQGHGCDRQRGPGNLHTVIISAVATSGSVVTIYDGISTGGAVLAAFTLAFPGGGNFNPMSFDFKGLPFSTGLFLVVATQNANVTLIYE